MQEGRLVVEEAKAMAQTEDWVTAAEKGAGDWATVGSKEEAGLLRPCSCPKPSF